MEHEHLKWEDLLLIASGLLEPDGDVLADPAQRDEILRSIDRCAICRRLAERSIDIPAPNPGEPVALTASPLLPPDSTGRMVLLRRSLGGAIAASIMLGVAIGISAFGLSVAITHGGAPVGPVLLGRVEGDNHFQLKSVLEDLGTITLSPRSRLRVVEARFHPGDEMRSTIQLENGDADLRLPAGGRARIKLISASGSAVVEWDDLDDGEADGLHLRIGESDPGNQANLDDITLQVVKGDITVHSSDSLYDRGLVLTDGDRAGFVRNRHDEIVARLITDAE